MWAQTPKTCSNSVDVSTFPDDVASNRWTQLTPLPKPLGAIATVAFRGKIHAIGGRDTVSVGDHYVYDPKTNKWSELAPLPGGRDHAGAVAINGFIHSHWRLTHDFDDE